jgi:DNA polymerase-3 subunit gamma/tau
MTYLALARKWRPRTFADVVGQQHIVRALTNALTSGRMHHAFLFAGTRGVGKTTVARILARCLNCETGVTAEPCGECSACLAIEQGRFVDLIEVDAASHTGVDDTRDLLDNVQYTPGAGRYKVYLIDEVHMLSKPAFNALLKTLEEPPPHVKFLFATTDPQKLPVTVLSRCLQFNLKRLPAALIVERMEKICKAEQVRAESGALSRLARAAAGSMRDALSLLDQALAYGNEALREADVAEMLGSLDRNRTLGLLGALAEAQPAQLLETIRELDELVPDYASLLDDLATALQRVAVIQLAGAEAIDEDDDVAAYRGLADRLEPELVQLWYQIAVTSRRDLDLAPDPRLGFEMALLRMLVFRPAALQEPLAASAVAAESPAPASCKPPAAAPRATPAAVPRPMPVAGKATLSGPDDWLSFAQGLGLEGAVKQLAMHTEFAAFTPFELRLHLERSNAHLLTDQLRARFTAAIQARLGNQVKVKFEVRDATAHTQAEREAQRSEEDLRKARQAIAEDPNVRDMVDLFGASVVPESVRPADGRETK